MVVGSRAEEALALILALDCGPQSLQWLFVTERVPSLPMTLQEAETPRFCVGRCDHPGEGARTASGSDWAPIPAPAPTSKLSLSLL